MKGLSVKYFPEGKNYAILVEVVSAIFIKNNEEYLVIKRPNIDTPVVCKLTQIRFV